MGFLNRLERACGHLAIPNISLYLVIGQVFFWSVSFLGFFEIERIALLPWAVMQGEVWRVFSFLLLPPGAHPVFIAFAWYMFYMMGSALEGHWGVFRYNIFLGLGWFLTMVAAFFFPTAYATNLFWAGSVFLAFALLNPEFELRLFFILPVKIKWLALIECILYGFEFIRGSWSVRFAVLAAVANFLIFFSGEILQRGKAGRRRKEYQAKQAAAWENDEPRHRCVVCGKTDRSHPHEDFRYSDDDKCYCAEHRPGAAKSN